MDFRSSIDEEIRLDSYSSESIYPVCNFQRAARFGGLAGEAEPGGGERIRTDDPRVANAMLYQLSYAPSEFRLEGIGGPGKT